MAVKFNISYNVRRQANDIVSAFHAVKQPIETILNSKNKSKINKVLGEINQKTGVSELSQESISFVDGNRKITLFSQNPFSFRLSEQNIKTHKVEKDLFINNSNLVDAKGFEKNTNSVEKFLNDVCNILDFPLLKLRQMFKNDNFVNFLETFAQRAKLSKQNLETANEIISLFSKIDANIMSISNPVSRSTVKNGYHLIKTGVRGSKQLTFTNINGNEYTVNVLNDHVSKTNLVIRISNAQNITDNIIIEPDGRVLKSKKINRKCIIGDKPEYYSQKELDAPEMKKYLLTVKDELEKYNEYIIEKINLRNTIKAKYSTGDTGVIDKQSIKLIKNLQKQYEFLRNKIHSLKDIERKNAAKNKLAIQTASGSPSILFKNAGPYEEDIHLSFPIINGKPSVKIISLSYHGNVRENFFIQDSKLVKFEAKNTSRSKRTDTEFNYYSQEEIESSKLKVYLHALEKRLSEITNIISKGAGWYR